MALIPLYRSNRRGTHLKFPQDYTLVDHATIPDHLASHPEIAPYYWLYRRLKGKRTSYALRNQKTDTGYKTVFLHNVVYTLLHGPIPDGYEVDHWHHDGLVNTEEELRLATRSDQVANTRPRRNSTSGYKGVTSRSDCPGLWVVIVSPREKHNCVVGYYRSRYEAAFAYNVAALLVFGEFACPNEIPPQHLPSSERLSRIEREIKGRWDPDLRQFSLKHPPQYATIFGETRRVNAWARDPRCVVTASIFSKRLKQGWDPEEALVTPVDPLANSTSGYKGVRKKTDKPRPNPWEAWFKVPTTEKAFLGAYSSSHEAAYAYMVAVQSVMGAGAYYTPIPEEHLPPPARQSQIRAEVERRLIRSGRVLAHEPPE